MALARYEYTARSGDTLERIIYDMYGWTPARQPVTYGATLRGVLALNPHLTDPDRLVPGTLLRLPADPTSAAVRAARPEILRQEGFASASLSKAERESVTALAWLARNSGWLTAPAGVAAGTGSALLNAGNRQLLLDIGDLYADYKQGRITRTAYKAQRQAKLAQFRHNIGPLERLLYPKAGVMGAMRGGNRLLPPDLSRSEVMRLKRLSDWASRAGIVLAGVGLSAACVAIAHTADPEEKNELFIDTIASTLGGMFYSVAAGVFVVSSPIGWGAAVIFAMGSAVTGWVAAKGVTSAYDAFGNQIDFVNGIGVDRICR